MKNIHYIAILALLSLVSCVSQQPKNVIDPNHITYYSYDPIDTIDNPYFFDLLKVDTGRVYYT